MIGKRAAGAAAKFAAPFVRSIGALGGLGDDQVRIAWPVGSRQRDDVVGDRPSLLGREAVDEGRHRRAVEPRAHRPEDVLAGRPAAEGPALGEIGSANRMVEIVLQRRRRRSVSASERPVAAGAPGVLVQLLPLRDGLGRHARRARKLDRLRDLPAVGEIRREGLDVVRQVRDVVVGEVGPGRHRGVGHAAADDVDEVRVRRQRAVGRRPHLELPGREVPGPGVAGAACRGPRRPPCHRDTARSSWCTAACRPPAGPRCRDRAPAPAPMRRLPRTPRR